jgi:hypothetical protein
MKPLRSLLLALLWCPVSVTVRAQEPVRAPLAQRVPGQAAEVEQWAVAVFNAPSTTRVVGPLEVDAETRYTGDVAVLDGPVVVRGVIEGSLVVINADVELLSGATIGGNVVVLGGNLADEEGVRVDGTMRQQRPALEVQLDEGLLVLLEPSSRREDHRHYPARSRASILVGLGGTYNRVEGLPLRLGAKFDWRRADVAVRLRGWGVFRTAGKFKTNSEDLGYTIDGQVTIGRATSLKIGARYFDLIVPTLDWPLELIEVGWGTFLWHRDYRDYRIQGGFGGFLEFRPTRALTLTTSVHRVDERSIAERDPWTLFRNSEPWRPNPAIDDGKYTLLAASVEYDTRRSRRAAASGAFLRVSWDRGIGDELSPQVLPPSVRDPLPLEAYAYDRMSVDARLYQRVGRRGQLKLRGLWAGAIGGDPLPIQRRYSLGGPDPLNGYAFRALGCNDLGDPAQTGLCDRVLLLQAEFRGGFGLDWFGGEPQDTGRALDDVGDGDWHDWLWFRGPTLVLFSNAGAGSLASEPMGSLSVDVGAGIEIGTFALYAAKALKDGEPLRWTLRIKQRF